MPPHHHTIDLQQLRGHRVVAVDAAVDGDGQQRKVGLQAVRHLVTQRRDFAVFLRAQALQPGVARVHDEDLAATALSHGADEVAHEAVILTAGDADAVLHRHRQRCRVAHGLHTLGHQGRFGHQAGAKGTALHTFAGAAAIQIDLVVAPLFGQFGAGRQVGGFAATQLQRHRVFDRAEVQVMRHVAVQQRAGGHHLGVQAGAARHQAVQDAAVPVGPVHHGRDGQAPGVKRLIGRHWSCLRRSRQGSVVAKQLARGLPADSAWQSMGDARGSCATGWWPPERMRQIGSAPAVWGLT